MYKGVLSNNYLYLSLVKKIQFFNTKFTHLFMKTVLHLGALKTRNWTSRNLTTRHHIARVDNARPENAAPDQTEVLEQSGAE